MLSLIAASAQLQKADNLFIMRQFQGGVSVGNVLFFNFLI
jgi:hypothetical protein